MGKYFDEKFNKNKKCNCMSCRMGVTPESVDVNDISVDIEFEHPDDIIIQYFNTIKEAESEDDVLQVLTGLFYEGMVYGTKQELFNDIQMKIEMLHSIEYDDET